MNEFTAFCLGILFLCTSFLVIIMAIERIKYMYDEDEEEVQDTDE